MGGHDKEAMQGRQTGCAAPERFFADTRCPNPSGRPTQCSAARYDHRSPMPLEIDRAICLRKTEYSETSQVVTLLTRSFGLIRAIAKGAHRKTKAGAGKFDGGIDLAELGDAVFTHEVSRELETLTEWTLRDGHLDLRRDLRSIYLAYYAGEMTDRLLEPHDPAPDLFDRVCVTLDALASPKREEVFLAYELELLRQTGYLPELSLCIGCGRPATLGSGPGFFVARLGGVVCSACEPKLPERRTIRTEHLRTAQHLLRRLASWQSERDRSAIEETATVQTASNEVMREKSTVADPVVGDGGDGDRAIDDRSTDNDATRMSSPGNLAAELPPLTRQQCDPLNRLLADHLQHTLGQRMLMPKWVL